jgi:hypothetical protein
MHLKGPPARVEDVLIEPLVEVVHYGNGMTS